LHREALQPLQEAGGCIYHAQHQGFFVGTRKTEWKKSNICVTKKGGKKPNSMKHSFAQLSKKMDSLEKMIKKLDATRKKHCHSNSDSNLE
jgi:hypothetical protein